jgi:hypothetical protein
LEMPRTIRGLKVARPCVVTFGSECVSHAPAEFTADEDPQFAG